MHYKEIGLQLLALRDRRKITLLQVARKAGCTAQYVSLVEKGKRAATLDKLDDIAKALDAQLHVMLITGEDIDRDIALRVAVLLPMMTPEVKLGFLNVIAGLEAILKPKS